MEFWWGLGIGIFAGANIGIVIAGLLAGSKRKEINQDYLWDQLQVGQAVMEGDHVKAPRVAHPLPNGSFDPHAAHF
jgi:hypothetical protein